MLNYLDQRWWFSLFATTWAMAACGDKDSIGPVADGTPVAFGAMSLALDGPFASFEHARRPVAPDAVRGFPVDVLCLNQVMRSEDKQAIADASSAVFPYAAWFPTDLETMPGDARTASGAVPEMPSSAPCGSTDLSAKASSAIQCLVDHCSTLEGSEEGSLTDGDCGVQSCVADFSELMFGDVEAQRCYSCLLYSVMSERFSDVRQACTLNPNSGFAFRGNNGSMILSKHPLANIRPWVLPSTGWRIVLLSATLMAKNAAPIDVHCATLQGPHSSSTQPYTGVYGGQATGDEGWRNENILQARRLVERVQVDSPTGRAIVWGDVYIGPEVSASDGGTRLAGVIPEAYAELGAAFSEAVPQGYEPLCTVCRDNPIIAGDTSLPGSWTAHVLGMNMPISAVESAGRFGEEALVSAEIPSTNPPQPIQIPISPRYGMRATIRLP